MRRTVTPAALALLALLAAASAAAQTDPRLEQLRPTRADTALAGRIAVRRSDLGPGWVRDRSPAPRREGVHCPGYDPDFSRFTITGLAHSSFRHPSGATVTSSVEVYPNRRQAASDFRLGTQPGVLGCLKRLAQRALDAANDGSYSARVVAGRAIAAPRVGERRAEYRIVIEAAAVGARITLVSDILAFQQGRAIAALTFTSPHRPLAGQAPLARTVAARMR